MSRLNYQNLYQKSIKQLWQTSNRNQIRWTICGYDGNIFFFQVKIRGYNHPRPQNNVCFDFLLNIFKVVFLKFEQ